VADSSEHGNELLEYINGGEFLDYAKRPLPLQADLFHLLYCVCVRTFVCGGLGPGFSAGPRRSLHTALIRAPTVPSPGTHHP
jgi:hypothetical protein